MHVRVAPASVVHIGMPFLVTAVVAAMLATDVPALPAHMLAAAELLTIRLSPPDSPLPPPRTGFRMSLPAPRTLWIRPAKVSLSIRPTRYLDGGLREFGKSWGAGVQVVSDAGAKLGVACYLAKVGAGIPLDRRLMLVLQVPLW
jgi:hypothetical protein